MPIYLRYLLSVADAIKAGTTHAGPGSHELSFDDTLKIRNGLGEAAEPFLAEEIAHQGSPPRLRILDANFPSAVFDALQARCKQIKILRDLVAYVDSPSWMSVQVLSSWTEDKLALEHPPEDLAAPAISDTATLATALVRWARRVDEAVRAETEREVADVHTLGQLLAGDLPPGDSVAVSLRHLLRTRGQVRFSPAWLPEEIQQKLADFWARRAAEDAERVAREQREAQARAAAAASHAKEVEKMISDLGRADQVERFTVGLLPDDEVDEISDLDAFADVPRPDGALVERVRPTRRPEVPGFTASTPWWSTCDHGVDAETWTRTAPLREAAARSDGRLRVAGYRTVTGVLLGRAGHPQHAVAHAVLVEAKDRLGQWALRQYTWVSPGEPHVDPVDSSTVSIVTQPGKIPVTSPLDTPEGWVELVDELIAPFSKDSRAIDRIELLGPDGAAVQSWDSSVWRERGAPYLATRVEGAVRACAAPHESASLELRAHFAEPDTIPCRIKTILRRAHATPRPTTTWISTPPSPEQVQQSRWWWARWPAGHRGTPCPVDAERTDLSGDRWRGVQWAPCVMPD